MTAREEVLARVKEAHTIRPIKRYVLHGTSGVEEVQCKCCDNPLRHLAPDDRFQEVRKIRGKNVIVERLILITLPTYIEVMMTMNDGSRHVTAICADCVKELTMDDMEWIYCCDLHEWLFDGSQDISDSFWAAQLARKPISFEVFPPGVIAS